MEGEDLGKQEPLQEISRREPVGKGFWDESVLVLNTYAHNP